MEKLEGTILELMREDGKSEEEVFEMVNKILIKTRKKAIRKKVGEKKKGRRKPVVDQCYLYQIHHVMKKLNKLNKLNKLKHKIKHICNQSS